MLEYTKHCGSRTLSEIKTRFDLAIYIQLHPLSKKNMIILAKKFNFSDEYSANLIGMTLNTYRKMRPVSVLSVPSSETIISLCELYEIGLTTFDGNSPIFINWLNTNIPVLGNLKPVQIITSGIGIEIVKEELLRMEHSIPPINGSINFLTTEAARKHFFKMIKNPRQPNKALQNAFKKHRKEIRK